MSGDSHLWFYLPGLMSGFPIGQILMKSIALALAAVVAFSTAGMAAPKKKSATQTDTTTQSGISPALREQAKSQAPTVGGRNGCTPWHQQTGAPC